MEGIGDMQAANNGTKRKWRKDQRELEVWKQQSEIEHGTGQGGLWARNNLAVLLILILKSQFRIFDSF